MVPKFPLPKDFQTNELTLHFRIAVIFASFTIHIVSVEYSQGSRRRVLLHKAQLCLLGLAELRDFWPFVDWMYRLFNNLLERLQHEDGSIAVGNSGQKDKYEQRPSADHTFPDEVPQNDSLIPETCMTSLVQTDPTSRENAMSAVLPIENFLDPCMLLDNFDWYDQSAAFFDQLDTQGVLWSESM